MLKGSSNGVSNTICTKSDNCPILFFNVILFIGVSMTEWLVVNLLLTAQGSNPDRDFGFFHVRKLSS